MCGLYTELAFLPEWVRSLYKEYLEDGHFDFSLSVIDNILLKPCGMWFGLFDNCLFDLNLKLGSLHELHRIVTMASVLSWGRFYPVP